MSEDHGFGLRVFNLPATTARPMQRLPVKGYGLAVLEAPADAVAELRIGTQDTAALLIRPGLALRTPVPFETLWLTNVAGAGGTIRIVIATEPDAAVLLGGIGDISMGGVTPGMGRDDTDDQAAATSGVLKVLSRLYGWDGTGGNWDRLRLDASGRLRVAPRGNATALADTLSNTVQVAADDTAAALSHRTLPHLFNGSSWDRQRSNAPWVVYVPSGSRSTTTQFSFTNWNAAAILLRLIVTVNPGGAETLTLKLVSGGSLYISGTALFGAGGTGTAYLVVGRGAAGSVAVGDIVGAPAPRDCTGEITHSGAGAWTYEVAYGMTS